MSKITLEINDINKFEAFLELIKSLNFIKVENVEDLKLNNNNDFMKYAGIWKNREIDATELRKKAWRL